MERRKVALASMMEGQELESLCWNLGTFLGPLMFSRSNLGTVQASLVVVATVQATLKACSDTSSGLYDNAQSFLLIIGLETVTT